MWYNPQATVLHIKEAANRHYLPVRVEFFRAPTLFYEKHYQATTPFHLDWAIRGGVWFFGGLDLLMRRLRGQYRTDNHRSQTGPGAGEKRTNGMKRSRILFVSSLVLTDAVMSLLAFFIAYMIGLGRADLRSAAPMSCCLPVSSWPRRC